MAIEPMETAYSPLYAQVKAILVERIGSGLWKPGEMIPNEFMLASEFNVSQGTVRKALIALEAEKLIDRQQGRGTYVARHTSEKSLFHFFRLVGLDDQRVTPTSRVLSQKTVAAGKEMAKALDVEAATKLHCITRVRDMAGVPAIFERIYVPQALMPSLEIKPGACMVDEMYVIYQEQFGVTIAHASERLGAVAASAEQAKLLAVAQGAPLLEITRIGRNVSKKPVEFRVSRCRTDMFRYATEIT
ncbi:MAG: GntR family transcriptional regulator [Acidocella sp.]|nr:GntR family transcriptional regulator [Acidocella sp.]